MKTKVVVKKSRIDPVWLWRVVVVTGSILNGPIASGCGASWEDALTHGLTMKRVLDGLDP